MASNPSAVRSFFGFIWRLIDGTRRAILNLIFILILVAILNALSCRMLAPERLRDEYGIDLQEGYLDLASFFRPGDCVAMIGCTGNYSCAAVGNCRTSGRST